MLEPAPRSDAVGTNFGLSTVDLLSTVPAHRSLKHDGTLSPDESALIVHKATWAEATSVNIQQLHQLFSFARSLSTDNTLVETMDVDHWKILYGGRAERRVYSQWTVVGRADISVKYCRFTDHKYAQGNTAQCTSSTHAERTGTDDGYHAQVRLSHNLEPPISYPATLAGLDKRYLRRPPLATIPIDNAIRTTSSSHFEGQEQLQSTKRLGPFHIFTLL